VNVEEPRSLQRSIVEVLSQCTARRGAGRRHDRGAGGIAGDGSLESGIEAEGGGGGDVEGGGVDAGVGTGGAAAARQDAATLAAGRRATSRSRQGRGLCDESVELGCGRLGMKDSPAGRGDGPRGGRDGFLGDGRLGVQDVGRWLERVLEGEGADGGLGALGGEGGIEVLRVVRVDNISGLALGSGRGDSCSLLAFSSRLDASCRPSSSSKQAAAHRPSRSVPFCLFFRLVRV
jgi:hypothetical protein